MQRADGGCPAAWDASGHHGVILHTDHDNFSTATMTERYPVVIKRTSIPGATEAGHEVITRNDGAASLYPADWEPGRPPTAGTAINTQRDIPSPV